MASTILEQFTDTKKYDSKSYWKQVYPEVEVLVKGNAFSFSADDCRIVCQKENSCRGPRLEAFLDVLTLYCYTSSNAQYPSLAGVFKGMRTSRRVANVTHGPNNELGLPLQYLWADFEKLVFYQGHRSKTKSGLKCAPHQGSGVVDFQKGIDLLLKHAVQTGIPRNCYGLIGIQDRDHDNRADKFRQYNECESFITEDDDLCTRHIMGSDRFDCMKGTCQKYFTEQFKGDFKVYRESLITGKELTVSPISITRTQPPSSGDRFRPPDYLVKQRDRLKPAFLEKLRAYTDQIIAMIKTEVISDKTADERASLLTINDYTDRRLWGVLDDAAVQNDVIKALQEKCLSIIRQRGDAKVQKHIPNLIGLFNAFYRESCNEEAISESERFVEFLTLALWFGDVQFNSLSLPPRSYPSE